MFQCLSPPLLRHRYQSQPRRVLPVVIVFARIRTKALFLQQADSSRTYRPPKPNLSREASGQCQVQEKWNLFEAYETWKARFGLLPHPGVILLVGLWTPNSECFMGS